MGLFSWLTADTQRSIPSCYSECETITVFMHCLFSDGSRAKFEERSYEGYGDFGGKDYFVLLSMMNASAAMNASLTEEQHRTRGIHISRGSEVLNGQILYPQLTESDKDPEVATFYKECQDCPAQGYFYNYDDWGDYPFFKLLVWKQ